MAKSAYLERKTTLISDYSCRNNVPKEDVVYGECLVLGEYWKAVTHISARSRLDSTIRSWYKIKEEVEKQ